METTVAHELAPLQSVGNLIGSLQSNAPVLGATWMISSALFTTYSTTKFLKYQSSRKNEISSAHFGSEIPRPVLLTLYRFAGSLLLGLAIHPQPLTLLSRFQSTLDAVPVFALSAFFLFVANFANSISLDRIGISLTYTSKCAIPAITVLLSLLLDGRQTLPKPLALLSLIPIAIGIAAASWNSPTFERLGFLAAMISATAQSALNVSSKKAMIKSGISGPSAQRTMVLVGLGITTAMTLVQTLQGEIFNHQKNKDNDDVAVVINNNETPPAWLSFMAAASYHVEYVLSFMFVKLVHPVTVGACDAVRRLAIILTGRAIFGGAPLTEGNKVGIALALMGALSYSVANSM